MPMVTGLHNVCNLRCRGIAELVLVISCLGGQIGINYHSVMTVICHHNCSYQTCEYMLVLKLISFNSGQLQISERVITNQKSVTK